MSSPKCQRCDGLLVTDYTECAELRIGRCLNCGDIIDRAILAQRDKAWERLYACLAQETTRRIAPRQRDKNPVSRY